MFGGGLALGNTILVSGAAQYIVDLLPTFSNSFILVILVVTTVSVFLTEFMSNTAFAATFIPIFLTFAKSLGMNPFLVILTVGVSSSLAFMLPIGTPPNAIVSKVKEVKISDMAKTGFFMNIISIFLWSLYAMLLSGFLF
jgi:sodium-dependent dicarboxylate transporter 2/3/5